MNAIKNTLNPEFSLSNGKLHDKKGKKIAVVLFNLGGPIDQAGVLPFLRNLFLDPHIIRLPSILRYPLAYLISTLRGNKAKAIYAQLGGGSPLNSNTQKQAQLLEESLQKSLSEDEIAVFMCMRYAPPMTMEVVKYVKDFSPDEVVLLPLYPQFSTTTTKSSLLEWKKESLKQNLSVKTHSFCCYPQENGFIQAYREILVQHLSEISHIPVKILFSAHGLPQDIVDEGDPYAEHINVSMHGVMDHDLLRHYPFEVCYQSKVGPKKWLKPSLDDALQTCQKEHVGAVIVPISFVSEHSETLVELDIQYEERAKEINLMHYSRISTVSCHEKFILGLHTMILERIDEKNTVKYQKKCHLTQKLCGYDQFSY